MMSNNFSREKCDTNDNQNKSVNPWTRDEKRSPAKEKVENKCNHLFFTKDRHLFKYSFDVHFFHIKSAVCISILSLKSDTILK